MLNKFFLSLIILVHIFILTKLIFFPYPELFIYPYLTNHGLAPYSQILDQHFPGLMFLPVNLDNLGMNTPEVARIWTIVIVLITQLLLFVISSKILKSKTKALLINILYLVWQPFFEGWVLWVDSFLPLLLLPAFIFLLEKKYFLTGLFLGFGIISKQTIIPLSCLILIYIFWSDPKMIKRYLLGLALPIILMILYFAKIGALNDFWYWTVVFNLTTYAQFGRGEGPTLAHLSRALFVFGFAFLVIRKIRLPQAQILLIFLIGTLAGLSTRFDFVHFQPALPFAVLATVYGLQGLPAGRQGFGLQTGYLLIAVWWLIIFYKGHLGNRIISFDSTSYNLAAKIRDNTNPGEKIFVYGAAPHLYQMSNTLPAGNIFVFQFPWFLEVAEGRILEGIKKDKPQIVISDRTVKIEDQKIIDFAPNIDRYILENYEKIDNVGDAEILRRK